MYTNVRKLFAYRERESVVDNAQPWHQDIIEGILIVIGDLLKHGRELLADTLEQLLDGGGVSDESYSHLAPSGRDVALSGQNVVGNPLHEVGGILVLHGLHLLLDFLHADLSAEDSSDLR